MISIKSFLERVDRKLAADSQLQKLFLHLRDVLNNGSELRSQLRPSAAHEVALNVSELVSRLDAADSSLQILGVATDALESYTKDIQGASEFFAEHNSQMSSMVAMLTQTLAEVSGHSDASVSRLHEIEQQIERASALDNIRALRESLEVCLTSVKEAVVQQRKSTESTVERLREHIKRAPQTPVEVAPPGPPGSSLGLSGEAPGEYVAAFKLQRADHILIRFGEGARDQMLAFIGEGLKAVQGPNDRLMRWKGPTFVMFLNSVENIQGVRRRLSAAVAKIGQSYIEVGKNAALLAVGVDWIVFPQAQYSSLDILFAEVDLFLGVPVGKL
jgi:GGDEF domain-containing protein